MLRLWRILLAAFLLAPRLASGAGREIRVAAAADLKFALEEVVTAYRRSYPDIAISVTYGSSGSFFAQIQNGAPFDLFLSADVDYTRRLAEGGLTVGPPFSYAMGRLALCVPASSPLPIETDGLKALSAPLVRKIAIANPRHAPYGRAAEEAMRRAGILDAVRERLVLGENVAQAAQFVQSGAADAGVVALSLALSPAMSSATRCRALSPDTHAPLVQGGAILRSARDPDAARALRDFLLGPDGRAVLARWGFEASGP